MASIGKSVFVGVVLGIGSAVQVPEAQTGIPPVSSFDRSLFANGKPDQTVHFAATKRLHLDYSLTDMKVGMHWVWMPPNTVGAVEVWRESVAFRPTALHAIVGSQAFLVAGVGAGGAVSIEKWEVGPPQTNAIGIPPNVAYKVSPGPITSKTALYSDATAAEGPINYFVTNHGSAGHVLLQFLESMNVYSMDDSTGAMTLVLAGDRFPDNLRAGFIGMLEVDHPTKGFIYFLLEDVNPAGGGQMPRFFVMDDPARDGTLSGVTELGEGDFNQNGYDDGTGLNSFFEWPPF